MNNFLAMKNAGQWVWGVVAWSTTIGVSVTVAAPPAPREPAGMDQVAPDQKPAPKIIIRGGLQGARVAPRHFTGDLRDLPQAPLWKPGDPIITGPRRRVTHEGATIPARNPVALQRDPLLAAQEGVIPMQAAAGNFTTPVLNVAGVGFTGVLPPDTAGAVGAKYYIQMVNGSGGAVFQIFDKTDGSTVVGPTELDSLWSAGGACAAGFGDPIILYDIMASRWMMAEFAGGGNHLCVYVSKIADPISGGWFLYDFVTPNFPDYPKYAVWPDAYYVSSNEPGVPGGALERRRMLEGLPAAVQRLGSSTLAGFGFQALTPSDLDGTALPPVGSPNYFMRHRDDEAHNPGANDPNQDFLDIWAFQVDFDNPVNTTFSLLQSIPIAEFDSDLCGLSSFECFPQPGTATTLDPLREVIMWRLQYRNFGSHEALVGNLVTDVDGSDHGGIRWFELRRTGGGLWSLQQEGTFAPDTDHRWMGSISMDGQGNIALGYSVSGAATFPGIRYTGRLETDSPGVMTTGEATIINGSASQTFATRWGDYSAMTVDPVDDCTLWYTTEYVPGNGQWNTQIAALRFPDPLCTDAPAPSCGNDQIDIGEDCDGAAVGLCPTSLCQSDCTCPPPLCGNDVREQGEECDGTDSACGGGVCSINCACVAPPVGVCCDSSRGCSELSELACGAASGIYLGDNSTCQATAGNPTVLLDFVNLAIPDDNPVGLSRTLNVPDSFVVGDVNIDLQITHTFVGDLIVTLTHGGTTVVVFDRPGVPDSTFGCGAADFDIFLDDEGTGGAIESQCTDNLASPPNYTPNQPLSAFDGLDAVGGWTVNVTDNAGQDTGALVRWSLHVDAVGPPPCQDFCGPCELSGDVFPFVQGASAANPVGNCIVDLDDVLVLLDSFSAVDQCSPGFPDTVNLFPCAQACSAGMIDIDDILAGLRAFSSVFNCAHVCAGGACCFGNGSCEDWDGLPPGVTPQGGVSQSTCFASGGTYQGDGTTCADVTCP